MITPPHVRDLLASSDSNYRASQTHVHHEYGRESEPEIEDRMDFPPPDSLTDETTLPRSPMVLSSMTSWALGVSEGVGTPNSQLYTGFRRGVTPDCISSSETSQFVVHRRPDNTKVR